MVLGEFDCGRLFIKFGMWSVILVCWVLGFSKWMIKGKGKVNKVYY